MAKIFKYFIFTALISILAISISYAKTLKGKVELDWPLLSQQERTKTINHYKDLLFKDIQRKIDMKQFEGGKKDPNVRINRTALKKGLRNLGERELAGFYFLGKILVIYGVKYFEDKYHIYYYDAMGRLKYVDILDKPHDEYPHVSYKYDNNGKFKEVSYYISEYDQYVFDKDGDFKGRWYFEKLYDKKAKVIMSRKLP